MFQSRKICSYAQSLNCISRKTIPRMVHLSYKQVNSCMCQLCYFQSQPDLVFIEANGKNVYSDFQACRNPVTGALRTRRATAVSLSGARAVNETELVAYGK